MRIDKGFRIDKGLEIGGYRFDATIVEIVNAEHSPLTNGRDTENASAIPGALLVRPPFLCQDQYIANPDCLACMYLGFMDTNISISSI